MTKKYIYVDDSGSPNQKPTNKFIASGTKTWTATILSRREEKYINTSIKALKTKISKKISCSEFHFTDIYTGQKEFRGVDPSLRLELFKEFVDIYNTSSPYVISYAVGETTLSNSGFSEKYTSLKINEFRYSDQSDYALFLVLLHLDEYLLKEQEKDDLDITIIIDEGRRKAGTIQTFSGLFHQLKEVSYQSSSRLYGLQFADFLAFSINRIQLNFTKNRQVYDDEFMKIIGKMKWNNNLDGIFVPNIDILNKDYIDSHIPQQGTLSSEQVKYIEELSYRISRKPSSVTKEVLIDDIKKLRIQNMDGMTDEFRRFLDVFLFMYGD